MKITTFDKNTAGRVCASGMPILNAHKYGSWITRGQNCNHSLTIACQFSLDGKKNQSRDVIGLDAEKNSVSGFHFFFFSVFVLSKIFPLLSNVVNRYILILANEYCYIPTFRPFTCLKIKTKTIYNTCLLLITFTGPLYRLSSVCRFASGTLCGFYITMHAVHAENSILLGIMLM